MRRDDRTGTVLHKSRKAEWWPAFLKCLLDGKSVRRIAAEVGISPTTAQAWRRKILAHLAERKPAALKGIVEYTELSVKSSNKGHKNKRFPAPRTAKGNPCFLQKPRRPRIRMSRRVRQLAGRMGAGGHSLV